MNVNLLKHKQVRYIEVENMFHTNRTNLGRSLKK